MVSSRTPGRRIASPFPPPSGTDERSIDVAGEKWPRCRVFHVAKQGEAFLAVSRRFATTSCFANPFPVSRQHLYALYSVIRQNSKMTKLVAALLRVARVTAGLAESNGSLQPGL